MHIRILLLILSASLVWPANAQTIVLDNVAPISLSTSASVGALSLDPQTGNVSVRTQLGTYNQCSTLTANAAAFNFDKAIAAGNTGLSINNSSRIDLQTGTPVNFLNRSVANGRRVINLRVAQPLLCADFAPSPSAGVNPVALQITDPNGDSSGLLFGGVISTSYFTNGASNSLLAVTANAQLACCIMGPAVNASCFQGSTSGFASTSRATAADVITPATSAGSADLSVTINAPGTAARGATYLYTVAITNTGGVAISGIQVRDWFPKSSGGFPAPLSSGAWTCSASAGASCGTSAGSGNIVLNAVSLNPAASVTLSISRTLSAAAVAGATFSVSAAAFAPPAAVEAVLGNNQISRSVIAL